MAKPPRDRVFAALLKYWRGHRGMSQLDLSLAADVSARHVSFLETGRSKPSVEMVLVLAETLDMPMRDTNELLRAAGFAEHYSEPSIDDLLSGPLGDAVETMLRHHEPFPMIVVNRLYDILRANQAGQRLFALAGVDLESSKQGEVNALRFLFDPATRDMIGDWPTAASTLLRRLQREVFHRPHDSEMAQLLGELADSPGVLPDWRQPDPGMRDEPMIGLEFQADDLGMRFLTTITEFNSPQNVTLEELRIESFFPLDDETRELCQQLLQ